MQFRSILSVSSFLEKPKCLECQQASFAGPFMAFPSGFPLLGISWQEDNNDVNMQPSMDAALVERGRLVEVPS